MKYYRHKVTKQIAGWDDITKVLVPERWEPVHVIPENDYKEMADRLEDTEDSIYCHNNRIGALEKQVKAIEEHFHTYHGDTTSKPLIEQPDTPKKEGYWWCPVHGKVTKYDTNINGTFCRVADDYGNFCRNRLEHRTDKPDEKPIVAIHDSNVCGCDTCREKWKADKPDEMPECCQYCGKSYLTVYCLPDEIWEKIKPSWKSEGAGLLCPQCADIIARAKGSSLYWEAAEGQFPTYRTDKPDESILEAEQRGHTQTASTADKPDDPRTDEEKNHEFAPVEVKAELPRCLDCGAETNVIEYGTQTKSCQCSIKPNLHVIGQTVETKAEAIAAYRRLVDDRAVADQKTYQEWFNDIVEGEGK